MAGCVDTLLLLGLPACGKSVIRRYLSTVSPDVARSDFNLGPTVALDDFPYVHFMKRICEIQDDMILDPAGGTSRQDWLGDIQDWATLMHLLNEDYAALHLPPPDVVEQPGRWIVGRLEGARRLSGASSLFARVGADAQAVVAAAIEAEAAAFAAEWCARRRVPGSTVVLEFARGGPEHSELPLDPPHGYAYSLSLLSEEILRRAAVLYVSVTPADSRRRNEERAKPGEDGSILHHGVPEPVLRSCYGMDDMGWLIDHSEQSGTITVRVHESKFHLPVACFDNSRSLDLFRRDDPATWLPAQVEEVHAALRTAFAGLATYR